MAVKTSSEYIESLQVPILQIRVLAKSCRSLTLSIRCTVRDIW